MFLSKAQALLSVLEGVLDTNTDGIEDDSFISVFVNKEGDIVDEDGEYYPECLFEPVGEAIPQVSRRTGNVLRTAGHFSPLLLHKPPGLGYIGAGITKGIVRHHHGLKSHIADYKATKKSIRKNGMLRPHEKRAQLDTLEKDTLHKIATKVGQQRDASRVAAGKYTKRDAGPTKRDVRTAKRSVYGSLAGTRVI